MDYSTLLAILVSLFAILLFSLFYDYLRTLIRFKNVPGPRPRLPILGNILMFYRPQIPLSRLSHVVFSELASTYKKEGMALIFLGSKPLLCLYKHEYAEQLLEDNGLINKADVYNVFKKWLGNGLITANGTIWKNKRRLLNPTFHSKILEDYIPTMNGECLKLIAKINELSEKEFIDIRHLISETTLNIISMTAMGVSMDEGSEEINEYRECLGHVPSVSVSRMYNAFNWYDFIFFRRDIGKQFKADVDYIHSFTQKVINKRKINFKPGIDFSDSKRMAFLDLLLTLQSEDNSITDENILDDVNTFLFTGHDTSSTGLTWTLFLLGIHKECQEKLIHEVNAIFGDDQQRDVNKDDLNKMHYAECVIKESMRLYPPVPLVGRVTNSKVQIGGHTFPKGTSIMISLKGVHMDEAAFPNPSDFIPERFESELKTHFSFMPFMMGPRNCIGQRFAMMEMKIILAHIFRNFRVNSIDKKSDMKIGADIILKALSPVRIFFTKL